MSQDLYDLREVIRLAVLSTHPIFALSRRLTPTRFVSHRGTMQPTSHNLYGLREVDPTGCPVDASHIRTVLSFDPDTIRFPSGENATDVT